MARSLCFMAFAVLAMMLFVAYEVQARECKAESVTFSGLCITKTPCIEACICEGFTNGRCSTILRRCLCTKPCVFDEKMIKTGAETLLEEEIMDN
ncbi:defensin-like protein [Nicotiana sylvestris]|uniref:Defensin-like protein n=2 Tax=Nicotiana TaxID=4085 RepID=A0A1S4DNN6_TOBAC|nr:PREDICTED: defensin-like protein [Nicotiana sylvestris]XP_016515033.1 PREDICTED: defensin-like protein [Nicotiana tabacum]